MSAIPLLTLESTIKRQLRSHLRQLGFSKSKNGSLIRPDYSKDCNRNLHAAQREELLCAEKDFISRAWPKLNKYFANGIDVNPEKIQPRLEAISGGTWQSDLFRLACLTWSVPVSKGYGRRLRFLVWDDSNNKLMGLIGLTDPVFNLKVRDELIGWDVKARRKRLVDMLDAFVLGALPPYNVLLCGKLIACLIKTKEVKDLFAEKYSNTRGVISGKKKHASLVMVTTSSALGKSSVYNRLKLGKDQIFQSIGYTSGWGHFHIPKGLFALIRRYLRRHRHRYSKNYRFGQGPNWKLRAIRYTLVNIGEDEDLLRHGISREVFVCLLARNAKNILKGTTKRPNYTGLETVEEVTARAKTRWIVPRAERRPDYKVWKKEMLYEMMTPSSALQKLEKIG